MSVLNTIYTPVETLSPFLFLPLQLACPPFAKSSKTKFPSISVIFIFASVTNPLIAIMPLYDSLTGLGKTFVVDYL